MLARDMINMFGLAAQDNLLKALNKTSDQEEPTTPLKEEGHIEIEYLKRYYQSSDAEIKLKKLIAHLAKSQPSCQHLHHSAKQFQIKNMEPNNGSENPEISKSTSFRFHQQHGFILTESLLQSKNTSLDENHWKQLLGLNHQTQKKSSGRILNYVPFKHKNIKNQQKSTKFSKQLECLQNNMAVSLRKLNKLDAKNLPVFKTKPK